MVVTCGICGKQVDTDEQIVSVTDQDEFICEDCLDANVEKVKQNKLNKEKSK